MSSLRFLYNKIVDAWNSNESSSEIYHMILTMLTVFRKEIANQTAVADIFRRMESSESTNDIVSDFIYGKQYAALRKECEEAD